MDHRVFVGPKPDRALLQGSTNPLITGHRIRLVVPIGEHRNGTHFASQRRDNLLRRPSTHYQLVP